MDAPDFENQLLSHYIDSYPEQSISDLEAFNDNEIVDIICDLSVKNISMVISRLSVHLARSGSLDYLAELPKSPLYGGLQYEIIRFKINASQKNG